MYVNSFVHCIYCLLFKGFFHLQLNGCVFIQMGNKNVCKVNYLAWFDLLLYKRPTEIPEPFFLHKMANFPANEIPVVFIYVRSLVI